MKLSVIAVGKLKTGPEKVLAEDYRARAEGLGRKAGITKFAVTEFAESGLATPAARRTEEAKLIAGALPAKAHVIVLDERGQNLSSEALAQHLRRQIDEGTPEIAESSPGVEETALAPLCLEQRHGAGRESDREGDPGGATSGANVHDGPVGGGHELGRSQCVVEQHGSRGCRIPDRREPRRRDDCREPALQDGVGGAVAQSAERRGRTTTNRVGSVPSLAVSTSGSSLSSSCTILRSTAVIGSSSTRWPVAAACSAARRVTVSSVAALRAR